MMMKKTSSRNQRANKGIKWKHVLQICVLVGVCVWLIYQVKYSHDKKKELFEKDEEVTRLSRNEDGAVKLGRKDLPNLHIVHKNERAVEDEDEEELNLREDEEKEEKERKSETQNNHSTEDDKEEEEEEDMEEEKNKHGEEDEVEEQDVEDDDTRDDSGAEDDIDEQDQGKTEENEREDENVEEEKESESNGKDEEEQKKVEIDKSVHEAREEQYKADDASSAVSHETHNEKGISRNSDTNIARVTIEQDNNSNNTDKIKLGKAEDETSLNNTNTEEKDGDGEAFGSDLKRKTQSDDLPEVRSQETEPKVETYNSNSTVTSLEASGLVQNGKEIKLDLIQEHNKSESVAALDGATDLPHDSGKYGTDSTITISANITNEESMKTQSLNTTSESVLLKKTTEAIATEVKESSEFSGDDESDDKESSNATETVKESLNLSSTNDASETVHSKESLNLSSTEETSETVDSSDKMISEEEMEALTDPQTLPDIRTEGSEEEAISAE